MKKYFTFRETEDDNFSRLMIIPINYETFPFSVQKGGSYNLAPSRILGLSYVEYLRFLMQSFPDDVTVEGKGSFYPVAFWKKGKTLYTFIDLLNARLELALKEVNDVTNTANISG